MSNEHQHSGPACQQQQQQQQYGRYNGSGHQCFIRCVDIQLLSSLPSDSQRSAVYAFNDCRQQLHINDTADGRQQPVADGCTLPRRRSAICRRACPGRHQRLPPLQVAASSTSLSGASAARRANIHSTATTTSTWRLDHVDWRRRRWRTVGQTN